MISIYHPGEANQDYDAPAAGSGNAVQSQFAFRRGVAMPAYIVKFQA
jgi:hypothetical protein